MKIPFLILMFIIFSLSVQAELIKTELGKLHSRVIISRASNEDAPVVYMVPGSGPNGPEEMMPGAVTTDGLSHPLFVELAAQLNALGFHAVLIGKPGIDFSAPDGSSQSYDKALYANLTWEQYLKNIEEVIELASRNFSSSKKILLGHSEGTMAAVFLAERKEYSAIIELGYLGRNLRKVLHYQTSERIIDAVTKLDKDRSGVLEKKEWERYPELKFFNEDDIPLSDFIELGRLNYEAVLKQYIDFPLWKGEVFDGEDFYGRAASLNVPVYVFQGELDVQTPLSEAIALENECGKRHKSDCFINIIPGVGHGFSKPKGPRVDPVFDATIGPMENGFFISLRENLKGLL